MSKQKIISVYKYCYLQWVVILCLAIGVFLLTSFSFEIKDEIVWFILWCILFGSICIMCVIFLINSYQTAEFSAEGIVLKTPFGVIKSIAWNDIFKISEEKLVTGTAGASIVYKMWVVIYTDRNQVSKYGGVNKKKKGPYTIAATTKNVEVINSFIKEYTNLPEIVMSIE